MKTLFRTFKQFLTRRATVLILICLVTTSILAATLLPQTALTGGQPPAWLAEVPLLCTIIDLLGLNRVVDTIWFALLAIVFLLSLLFSLSDQFEAAWYRLRKPPPEQPSADSVMIKAGSGLDERLKRWGFTVAIQGSQARRFVKGKWGFFGNPLLHTGMAVVILASLVYVMTEHRLLLRLMEGEPYWLEEAITAESRGGLASSLSLPKAIIVDKVTPTFWDNDQISALSVLITFPRPDEEPDRITVGVNDAAWYHGMRVTVRNSLGAAFDLDVAEQGKGSTPIRLMLPIQPNRNRPGYGSAPDVLGRYTLKAKYLGDETRQGVLLTHPLLTVRLMDGERLLGEGVLRPGMSATVGPALIRLNRFAWRIELVLEGSYGMTCIFIGFALLITGVIVVYVVVPREITVWDAPDGTRVSWRAFRLDRLYREEWERILRDLDNGGAS